MFVLLNIYKNFIWNL